MQGVHCYFLMRVTWPSAAEEKCEGKDALVWGAHRHSEISCA